MNRSVSAFVFTLFVLLPLPTLATAQTNGAIDWRELPPRRSLTAAEEAQLRGELAASSFAERLLTGEGCPTTR